MVSVGGKVVAIDVDLVAIGLGHNGDHEESARQDATVSITLFIEPLVVGIAAADDVVFVQAHIKPEADGVTIVSTGLWNQVNVE